jgi:hypothetical protein
MTTILSNQPFSIKVGASEAGPLDLPDGTTTLLVTYDCGGWPSVSDGTMTVTILVANDGANYAPIWTDTFQHVLLSHGGVPVSQASFGVGLGVPFPHAARMKVAFTSTCPAAVATTVTVQAT